MLVVSYNYNSTVLTRSGLDEPACGQKSAPSILLFTAPGKRVHPAYRRRWVKILPRDEHLEGRRGVVSSHTPSLINTPGAIPRSTVYFCRPVMRFYFPSRATQTMLCLCDSSGFIEGKSEEKQDGNVLMHAPSAALAILVPETVVAADYEYWLYVCHLEALFCHGHAV